MIIDQFEKLGGRPYASSSNDAFRQFLNTFGLVDLGFYGNPYTWSNNREGRHLIKEILDRALATTQLIHLFPTCTVRHLPAHNSDHNPILLDTIFTNVYLPCPFRFEEFWLKDPSCGSVISAAWSSTFVGSPAYTLS